MRKHMKKEDKKKDLQKVISYKYDIQDVEVLMLMRKFRRVIKKIKLIKD